MDDDNVLDAAAEDLGIDKQGRKIIYRHVFAGPVEIIDNLKGDVVESAKEMRFREPTGGDVASVGGLPARIALDGEGFLKIDIDAPKMAQMMAALMVSDHTPPVSRALVNRMPANDWAEIALALSRFFTPRASTA